MAQWLVRITMDRGWGAGKEAGVVQLMASVQGQRACPGEGG